MKKFFIVLLTLCIGLSFIGCSNYYSEKSNEAISKQNEIISLYEQIQELENEIEKLKKDKADSDIIAELEKKLSELNEYIEKIDERTKSIPDWDSFTAFNFEEIVKLINEDYNYFINEYENRVLSFAGICIDAGECDGGYEYIKLSNSLEEEPQIYLKTIYRNGETLDFIGKYTSIKAIYKNGAGFIEARLAGNLSLQFPSDLFNFINIKKPSVINYKTIKEAIGNTDNPVNIEIKLNFENKGFIQTHKLDSIFQEIITKDNKTFSLTLKDNILEPKMFIAMLQIIRENNLERVVTIKADIPGICFNEDKVREQRLDIEKPVKVIIFFSYRIDVPLIETGGAEVDLERYREEIKKFCIENNNKYIKHFNIDKLEYEIFISSYSSMVSIVFENYNDFVANRDFFVNISGYDEIGIIYIENPGIAADA